MGTTALTLAGLPYDIVSILALSARMAVGIALFSWQLPRTASGSSIHHHACHEPCRV